MHDEGPSLRVIWVCMFMDMTMHVFVRQDHAAWVLCQLCATPRISNMYGQALPEQHILVAYLSGCCASPPFLGAFRMTHEPDA